MLLLQAFFRMEASIYWSVTCGTAALGGNKALPGGEGPYMDRMLLASEEDNRLEKSGE
jgi:hypothetical protein